MSFVYEIPAEFENEERWFKILTLKSMLCCLAAFGIGVVCTKISNALFSTSAPGIVIGALLVLASYIITMVKLPAEDYFKGGGLVIEQYLINRIYRKRFSFLYVLGFHNEEV